MSVSSEGSYIEILQEIPKPDTVGTEKKACKDTAPVGTAHQALPDDVVTENEDEVFKEALGVGEVFYGWIFHSLLVLLVDRFILHINTRVLLLLSNLKIVTVSVCA